MGVGSGVEEGLIGRERAENPGPLYVSIAMTTHGSFFIK